MDVLVWFSICFIYCHLPAAECISGKLLFASSQSIIEVDIYTHSMSVLLGMALVVYSLDYDDENKYVYFPRIDFGDIMRWLYIGYHTSGISKSRFDLTEFSFIANFKSNNLVWVVCMDIDITNHRLYWITYDGDIKSVNDDGSDEKTIMSTNSAKRYYAMGVFGSNFYYADKNQLVMRNTSERSTPTVVYTDTSSIFSIYAFNQIYKCDPNPCQNKGKCTDFKDGYNCTCTTGWKGENCTKGLTSDINVHKSTDSIGAIVGIVAGIVLSVCIFCIGIYIGRRCSFCAKTKDTMRDDPKTNNHIGNQEVGLSQPVSDPPHVQYANLQSQSGDRSTNDNRQNISDHEYDYPDMVNYGYETLSDVTSTPENIVLQDGILNRNPYTNGNTAE
ncbi:NOTCH1 [Mytilus edulis]|uniref:NOTCH1 n=1 Tax=Mytilus edulis TaxID=6550 RepID=A0A8S3QSF6_MYTED|nr:NOTCH1 [Mytilus edulis]